MCNQDNKAVKHSVVLVVPDGVDTAQISKALNNGDEVDMNVNFDQVGDCKVLAHIQSKRHLSGFPIPRAVTIDGGNS